MTAAPHIAAFMRATALSLPRNLRKIEYHLVFITGHCQMLFRNAWVRKGLAAMIALCLLATAANAQTTPSPATLLDDVDAASIKEHERAFQLPEARRWRADIQAHLARAKQYPSSQIPPGGRARTVVDFRITRDGKVIRTRIRESSGQAAFDEAAVRSIRIADPFPAAPPAFTLREINFTVPFSFHGGFAATQPRAPPTSSTSPNCDDRRGQGGGCRETTFA